jgi:hypothetical protein
MIMLHYPSRAVLGGMAFMIVVKKVSFAVNLSRFGLEDFGDSAKQI